MQYFEPELFSDFIIIEVVFQGAKCVVSVEFAERPG
jgi:hypothetical protein